MIKTTTATENIESKTSPVKLKGKYICGLGKRKSASAQVRLYKNGTGLFIVNGSENDYFSQDLMNVVKQPLKLTGHIKDINISIILKGGGKKGQADAARHGLSRVLVELDSELRPAMRAKSYLTRDARIKERKKPGLKKARKAPQWAKR